MYDRTTPQKPVSKSVGYSNGTLTTLVYEDDLSKKSNELVVKEEDESIPRRVSNDVSVVKVEDEIFENTQADDEKSVIALLDDVIQNEEGLLTPDFERSLSADSSFDPTHTVAIVHSQIVEPSLDENALLESQVYFTEDEVKLAAEEFVEEMLNSDEIAVVLKKLNVEKKEPSVVSQESTSHSDPPPEPLYILKISRKN